MYLVPDLGVGGAERHVTTLMPALDPNRFEPSVICIGEQGALFGALPEADVPAMALHRSKRQALAAVRELTREMRRLAPDVVITRGYIA
ncbi:MAG: glycosyltransferase, partial [Mycobacterium sp.]|nr:glycosyltransferase [Mycobacterium sp.]